MKKYDEYQLGFDRTQLYKEYEGPMIRRQSALNAAQSFFSNNNIAYSAMDLKALYLRFLKMIENGDTDFFEGLDKWLNDENKR
jgi:hypothetical protein